MTHAGSQRHRKKKLQKRNKNICNDSYLISQECLGLQKGQSLVYSTLIGNFVRFSNPCLVWILFATTSACLCMLKSKMFSFISFLFNWLFHSLPKIFYQFSFVVLKMNNGRFTLKSTSYSGASRI